MSASGLDKAYHCHPPNVSERVRLMRDGIINYSGTFVVEAIGILLVPIRLTGLGREIYGLWMAP